MGTPHELGEFTEIHAELEITGMFSAPDIERYSSMQAPELFGATTTILTWI